MIRFWIIGLLAFAAACRPEPTTTLATPESSATPNPLATAVPTTAAVTRIIVQVTAPPPTIVLPVAAPSQTAAPAKRVGWPTYVDSGLHLAVEYPPDWTVHAENTGRTFTSPQGLTIQLVPVDPRALAPSGESIQPNTRCGETVNPNRILVRTCRATIGFSVSAYLEIDPTTAAVISANNSATYDVFSGMVESARVVP